MVLGEKKIMIKRSVILFVLPFLILSACTTTPDEQAGAVNDSGKFIEVYRSPTWGCCGDWITYVEKNGYTVAVKDTNDLSAVKAQYKVPPTLQSCHTAIVDGYIIEGHVPIEDIERLLADKPEITGLAVPGMPIGSPGMEVAGAESQPFDVIAFDKSGNMEVFASYRQ